MNVCKTSRNPQLFIKNIASLDNSLLARQEPIADTMHGFNVGGIALIIVQLAAQLGHGHGNIVAVGVLIHPYRLTNALGSENDTRIPRKERKQPKLPTLQVYGNAALRHGVAAQINYQISTVEHDGICLVWIIVIIDFVSPDKSHRLRLQNIHACVRRHTNISTNF